MDFDAFEEQFEKEQVVKQKPKEQKDAGDCCTRPVSRDHNGNGILDAFEDWEDYMQYGMGGRPGRDHFGFHLPYRSRNDA